MVLLVTKLLWNCFNLLIHSCESSNLASWWPNVISWFFAYCWTSRWEIIPHPIFMLMCLYGFVHMPTQKFRWHLLPTSFIIVAVQSIVNYVLIYFSIVIWATRSIVDPTYVALFSFFSSFSFHLFSLISIAVVLSMVFFHMIFKFW